ncbi:DUF3108 domain-containing protein [Halobacillus litoralis]|uniref:DUF3108 domain-containing protein n=1 Tax=Halobacillus litoralis TaxID=45668 RepID=UPI001CD7D028|nr:DUF3108 domain-containing protein [Halobacillus litoralis]MCA0971411.1 DUF3108 domain-containing protein [Halobacillus litoralis]
MTPYNLNGEPIKPTYDKKNVYLIDHGHERHVGFTTENVTVNQIKNEEVIIREQSLISDTIGNRKIHLMVNQKTLSPIQFSETIGETEHISADYKKHVVQVTKDDQTHIHPLSECVMDSFSLELALRILPFHNDYSTTLNAFHPTQQTTVLISVHVLGMEAVYADSERKVEAWKIECLFGERRQVYWVYVDGRELLKQASQVGENVRMEFRRD